MDLIAVVGIAVGLSMDAFALLAFIGGRMVWNGLPFGKGGAESASS